MNSYSKFVSDIARIMEEGKSCPLGDFPPAARPDISEDAPRVIVFPPHPDDECIIGGLPLRLLRELKMRVIVAAVTHGSRKDRQRERFLEMTGACNYLGFELIRIKENGLEKINLTTRRQDPQTWEQAVEAVAEILSINRPQTVFFPHDSDWNTTHVGTHYLVVDALARMDADFSCYTVETEFWGAMATPNLMVESSVQDVVDLVTAISFHVGEVQRNPYHLRLPAWMLDNVRRGSEIVGGQGSGAPDFLFATLYRLRRWEGGRMADVLPGGRVISVYDDLAGFFPLQR